MKLRFIASAVIAFSLCANAQEWQPVGDNIRTPWAEQIDPKNPLPEYPRPQMLRNEWMNLNGLWDYAVTGKDAVGFESEGKILVPFAIESSLSGVGRKVGKEDVLWYERTFTIPRKWKDKEIILHFGAVDWKAEVYVNGKKAGVHTGGYTPFSYNITPLLNKKGEQVLRVKVTDASDNSFQPNGKQTLHPMGIWYTAVTGIWQTVWLEPVADTHIKSYLASADIDNGKVTINIDAENIHEGDAIEVALLEGGLGYSPEKPSETIICKATAEDGTVSMEVPQIKTWSPDSPYLYGLEISITREGRKIDSIQGYASMRKISMMRDKEGYARMALNNEPLFHYGTLDQGWWPDGLYTAPTDEALAYDIIKTKELGFNMIRKHIKVEPARWFWWCDVHGMMVWQDMPCCGDHSPGQLQYRDPEIAEAHRNSWPGHTFVPGTDCNIPQEWKENFKKEWAEIINTYKGFQCIVVWIPFNEGWGQFDTKEITEYTRHIDSSRLVSPASGGNHCFYGDIIDVHHYPAPAMNIFEKRFINVIGEYGGIGLPVNGHLWQKDRNWGYGGVKKDGEEVLALYDEFAQMLKGFIDRGCAGAVYTQITDVEGEVNGLITYDRKVVKVDEASLNRINQAVIAHMKNGCMTR